MPFAIPLAVTVLSVTATLAVEEERERRSLGDVPAGAE
jgi:hypothetical protein